MFGLKKSEKTASGETPEQTQERLDSEVSGAKKGPTPKRKDQVAARQRPLVSADRAQAKVNDRQRRAAEQEKIRIGMATGQEQYLLPRDRGPQRRFARNFVDRRTCLAEWFFPIVIVFFIVSIGFSGLLGIQGQAVATIAMYVVFLLVAIDMFITSRMLKRAILAKFGAPERGVIWYGTFRSMQMRFMRQPKAQVKRGESID